jgi:hypothetical protein
MKAIIDRVEGKLAIRGCSLWINLPFSGVLPDVAYLHSWSLREALLHMSLHSQGFGAFSRMVQPTNPAADGQLGARL